MKLTGNVAPAAEKAKQMTGQASQKANQVSGLAYASNQHWLTPCPDLCGPEGGSTGLQGRREEGSPQVKLVVSPAGVTAIATMYCTSIPVAYLHVLHRMH